MVLVSADTRMAGIPMGPSCNSLLWHWVRIILIGLAAVLIAMTQSSCGSSKSDAPAANVQESPAKPAVVDTRPAIVAFGDSLTAGFGAEPGQSYADFLQKDLDRAGLRWRVVNQGVSGDTTTDGANRVNEVLAVKPRVVILEFGGNDGLRGLPIETTKANLEQMIQELQESGATVILAGMTLPPNYGADYIHGFERVYQDLAVKYKLVRIPFLLQGVATDRNLMQRDGIHPTGPGNEKVAETVMNYVRPVLGGKN
jgi:acyl-CoA thioesterase I